MTAASSLCYPFVPKARTADSQLPLITVGFGERLGSSKGRYASARLGLPTRSAHRPPPSYLFRQRSRSPHPASPHHAGPHPRRQSTREALGQLAGPRGQETPALLRPRRLAVNGPRSSRRWYAFPKPYRQRSLRQPSLARRAGLVYAAFVPALVDPATRPMRWSRPG